jgi:hypothetical protein
MPVGKGAFCIVSDGKNFKIWSDLWVPTIPGFKLVANPTLAYLPELKVSDHIMPHNRIWEVHGKTY